MKPQVTASLDDVPVVRSFAGPEHANCAGCELRQACNGLDARPVRGEHPEDWEEGGLMIIGEGPGREEISYQRPFIGASGRLLNDLLSTLGIKRHAVWVTNATLGYPDPRYSPPKAKGETFSKRFPHATLACRSRLMAEITAARPRVIVTLGRAAFHALAGREYEKRRQVPNPCPNVRCHDDWGRKVGPIIACHSSTCDWHVVSPQDVFEAGRAEMLKWVAAGNETKRWQPDAWVRWADRELEAVGRHCPKCQKKVRCQPRMVKCATCGGTKVKVVSERFLTDDYPLVGREGAAGAVFRGDELDLAQHGVAYVIPTYHPAFCLYGSINTGTKKKQIGGQFAARVMLEHLRTAQRLLDGGEQTWRDPNVVIAGPGGVERIELQEDRRTHAARTEAVDPIEAIRAWLARPGRVSVDIETDSYDGPEAVTRIACIGFARADSHDALVVDTRMVYPKAPPATDQESRAKWRLPTEREQLFADDFLDVLEAFFDREDVETVFHNGSYDRFVIHRLWNLWVHNVGNDTMLAHNVCYPDEEHGLGFVAHELLDAPLWKGHERFKQPGAGRVHELSGYPDFTALAIYNARDTRATALVDEVLRGPIGGQGRVQAEGVEVALDDDVFNQDLGLRMTIAGIPIHAGRRDELRTAFRQELDDLTVKCRQITHRADFVPTNNGHLAWAFFAPDGPCGFPATKYGKKGEPSVAKDILKPLYGQHPLVEHVLRFKTIAYYLSHYVDGADLRVGPDGRIHPSWKPGLVTGRWSSEPNCFDAATEVLTPEGWMRMDEFCARPEAPQVMQAEPTDEGIRFSWAQPTQRIVQHDRELLHVRSQQLDICATADHRMLFRRRSGAWEERTFGEWQGDLQVHQAGRFVAPSVRHEHLDLHRFIVATQADGEYTAGHQIVFTFDKVRKVARMRALLQALNANYVEKRTQTGARKRVRFIVSGELARTVRRDFPEKRFTWAWFETVLAQGLACEVAAELFHWDGCLSRESMYASQHRENVDIAQALVVLSGRRAKIREYAPANPNASVSYQLDVSKRVHSWTTKHTPQPVEGRHTVYCLSVPTSCVLIRRNGKASVTKQCQNWPKGSAKKPELNMRRMVVAPPGRRFVGIDYSQLELRIMAALSDDPALIQLIVNADESDKLNPDKDPHSYLARAVFRDAYMNADKETRKKLRDCVKRVWYGSLYGAGAQTIMDSILDSDYEGPPLTRPFVEGVLQMIGKAFPGTQRWKDKQVRDLLRNSEVWAPRSRRHRIFPLNEAEVTIAMNFPIQSCAADLMNWRVRILDARLPDVDPTAAIILQVHDAIYIECDEDRTDAVKRLSEECLRVEWTVPGTSTPMFFDASADDAASWDAC